MSTQIDERYGKPIRPDSLPDGRRSRGVPEWAVEVFNRLIREKWDGYRAMIAEGEVVEAVLREARDCTRQQIADWLVAVPEMFANAGWSYSHNSGYISFWKPDKKG